MSRISIKVVARDSGTASIGSVHVDESRHRATTSRSHNDTDVTKNRRSNNTRGDTTTAVEVSGRFAKAKGKDGGNANASNGGGK